MYSGMTPKALDWQKKIRKFVNEELIPWEVHAEKFDGELPKEKVKLSEKNLARGFQALIMGLWLDQLEDPDTFNKVQSKKICFEFIKSNFPKQFKNVL